jgi:NinB protein
MSRWSFIVGPRTRDTLRRWLDRAPDGFRIEFREPQRTDAQNRLLWPLLTALSTQLDWHGQKYSPDDWKDYMMHALKRARWMPDENGGMVPIGMRSSKLGVSEFSDLIEMIYEFGARHGVVFHDQARAEAA